MLGKLLKYELKATSRTFVPLYIAILIVSVINRLLGFDKRVGIISGLGNLILVGLFVALVVITLVVIVQRFQKNLLLDEGYLMFTLPVKASSLISSKLIATFIWSLCSGLTAFGSFLILLANKRFFSDFWRAISELRNLMIMQDMSMIVWMGVEIIVLAILGYIASVLMIYFSLATGQLPKFNKHRILSSFITFFVLNIVIQWITMLFGDKIGMLLDLGTPSGLGYLIGVNGILAAALFAGTNYLLKRHLNLE